MSEENINEGLASQAETQVLKDQRAEIIRQLNAPENNVRFSGQAGFGAGSHEMDPEANAAARSQEATRDRLLKELKPINEKLGLEANSTEVVS